MFASMKLRAHPARRNDEIPPANAERIALRPKSARVARLVGRWTSATGGATLTWIWRLETA